MPLLTNNAWRTRLSRAIDEACQPLGCHLAAFVYMPEHVHLLVWGLRAKEDVSTLLAEIKRPFSRHIHQDLVAHRSPLLQRLMVRQRPGKIASRYWQEGPGFDRNLFTVKAVRASLDYIHMNPVKRGLCTRASEWPWSSARYYELDGQYVNPAWPKIEPLPAEFWLGGQSL
jgi:putative transposase